MYLPVPGIEPMSSLFLGECASQDSTVAANFSLTFHNQYNLLED